MSNHINQVATELHYLFNSDVASSPSSAKYTGEAHEKDEADDSDGDADNSAFLQSAVASLVWFIVAVVVAVTLEVGGDAYPVAAPKVVPITRSCKCTKCATG